MKSGIILLILALSCVACQKQSDEILRVSDAPQKRRIESVLMRVLDERGGSGSLAYRGFCDPSGDISDSFHLDAPSREAVRPVDAFREILNRNPGLVVTEDQDGLLRIASRDVSRSFLDSRINVSFASESDPNEAMANALHKAEFGALAGDHHFSLDLMTGGLRPGLTVDSPRIKGQLNGVTVAEAFDYILRVFPGMWVYQECVTANGDTKASVGFIRSSTQNPRKRR
jgi:hypothetical protein